MEGIGNKNDPKIPKLTVSNLVVISLQQLHCLIHGHRSKKTQAQNPQIREIINLSRDLKSLIDKVISHSLNNHVTLSRSQRFIIDAKDQSLAGFLYGNTTRALQCSK